MKKLSSLLILAIFLIGLVPAGVYADNGSKYKDFRGYIIYEEGKTKKDIWYVDPENGYRYPLKTYLSTWSFIKNSAVAKKEKGKFLAAKGTKSRIWYVHPATGKRYELKNASHALRVLKKLAQPVSKETMLAYEIGIFISPAKKLSLFSSEKAFDSYAAKLKQLANEKVNAEGGVGLGGGAEGEGEVVESAAPTDGITSSAKSEKESITNVQEQGVDEGDIVKVYKDYLVVLRRGRLFSIKTKEAENPVLKPVSKINAYPEGLTGSSWYDEMLIYGNRVIVIGYSYERYATEVGLFSINEDGVLNHNETYFLDSFDYYSSRNYASRLVSGKLVFYMPIPLFDYFYDAETYQSRVDVKLPTMKKWAAGTDTLESKDILSKVDIYKPLQESSEPTLHTIVTCGLEENFSCSAKAVLGPYSRNFYVSPEAVYIWVNENWYKPDSFVYRMSLKDGATTALRAFGSPIDQFSFKEQNGYLNVLLTNEGRGEAMWQSEATTGQFALLRTPLTLFSDSPAEASKELFSALPSPVETSWYGVQNRFVGDYLLYGAGSSWWDETSEAAGSSTLYAKKFESTESTAQISLPHYLSRIEQMGDVALAAGASGKDLKFSAISLGNVPAVTGTYTKEQASEGELRSHGFFYKPQADGTGILGLPVRSEGDAVSSHWDDSSEIFFLKVSLEKTFSALGSLINSKITKETEVDDKCEVSCIDWYGNSRPIFYSGRIFALLGYELIEGKIADNVLSEFQRTNFTDVAR